MLVCKDNLEKIYKYLLLLPATKAERLSFSLVSKTCREIFWRYKSPENDKIFKNFSQLKDVKKHIGDFDLLVWGLFLNACMRGYLEVVEYLVSANALVDITADDNYAVSLASGHGHLEIVKHLTEPDFRLDASIKACFNGTSANALADITADDNHAVTWASANGHLGVVKYLVGIGADITADDNAAARWASFNGHLEVVKYLVDVRADITADNHYAVRWASRNGYLEVVKYLVDVRTKTAPNGADITAWDNYAVRWASANGHLEVVKYLVHVRTKTAPSGADTTAQDNYAVLWASANGHLEVVKYLKSRIKLNKHPYIKSHNIFFLFF